MVEVNSLLQTEPKKTSCIKQKSTAKKNNNNNNNTEKKIKSKAKPILIIEIIKNTYTFYITKNEYSITIIQDNTTYFTFLMLF